MYADDYTLGVTPIDAVFAVASLKNLFGIGKKKRQLKAIEGQAAGYWTSGFPPEVDWKEYLAKFDGAVAKDYDKARKRKDSLLIKNNIATPEDFAAWHFANYGEEHASQNKLWIPYRKDGTRFDQPSAAERASTQAALSKAAAAQKAKPKPAAPAPAPSAVDKIVAQLQAQGYQPSAQVQQFLPGAPTVQYPAPAAAAPPPAAGGVPKWVWYAAPAVVIGGAALFMMMGPQSAPRAPARRRRARVRR
jgi:hypothetical protein